MWSDRDQKRPRQRDITEVERLLTMDAGEESEVEGRVEHGRARWRGREDGERRERRDKIKQPNIMFKRK